jgi:prolyl oligopeptidase
VREFDLASRSFVQDGFALAEAKSNITYLDEDTVLFGTDFGADSMTASGYPRVVKLWRRGQPMAAARTLFEAKTADVGAQAAVFHGSQGSVAVIERTVTFFTSEYQLLQPDGSLHALPVPLGADLKGVLDRRLLFTLREDWAPDGAAAIGKGSLIAYQLGPDGAPTAGKGASVLITPDAKSSIDEVVVGRDAVFASIYRDVTGSVHAFRPTAEGRWSDEVLPLHAGGSAHVVSANAFVFALLSALRVSHPTTSTSTGDAPVAINVAVGALCASNCHGAVLRDLKDGTRVPYFATRAGAPSTGADGAVWLRWL